MGIWLVLGFLAVAVGNYLLRPRPKYPTPKPSSLQDFDLPRAEEGAPIPVVFGTCWLKAPNCVWRGDFRKLSIRQDGQTIGYKYYMGQQLVLSHGVLDELIDVRWDERSIPGSTVTIDGSNDTLVFGNDPFSAGAWRVLKMPHGQYTYTQLQQDLTAEMTNVLSGDGYFGVAIYGYHIVTGWNDWVVYKITGVDGAGQVATMNPGFYASHQAMADEVARAINAKEALRGGGAQMNVTGAVNGNLLQWTGVKLGGAGTGWQIDGGGNNAQGRAAYTIGLITGLGSSVTGNLGTINAYRPTAPKRWKLLVGTLAGNLAMRASWRERIASIVGPYTLASGPPTTSNMLNTLGFLPRGNWPGSTPDWDPDTNPLGMDPLVDKIMADFDVETSGLTITDLGDYWRVQVLQPPLSATGKFIAALWGIVYEIGGDIDVYKGTATQVANDYLQTARGITLPAYRRVAHAVLRRFHVANQQYLKPISFVVRSCPNNLALTGGDHNINGAANPAAIIYEAYTAWWSAKKPEGELDLTALRAFGHQLALEGFGLSMVWDGLADADQLVDDVLRTVDGVRYEDPATGKVVFKLIRPDYAIPNLLKLDDESAPCRSFARPSWAETRNIVNLTYVDRLWNFTRRTVQDQDSGNVQTRGKPVPEDVEFLGIDNAGIATKVAYRVRRTLAARAARIRLEADRRAASLRPGDPFLWGSQRLGIAGMPVRVTKISPGSAEDGKVTLEAIEDVFGPTWATFTPPGSPGGGANWSPPALGSGWGFNWGGDWGA